MRDFCNRPAITNLATLVHAFMPIIVGRQDLARGGLLVRATYRVEVKISRGVKQPSASGRVGWGRT